MADRVARTGTAGPSSSKGITSNKGTSSAATFNAVQTPRHPPISASIAEHTASSAAFATAAGRPVRWAPATAGTSKYATSRPHTIQGKHPTAAPARKTGSSSRRAPASITAPGPQPTQPSRLTEGKKPAFQMPVFSELQDTRRRDAPSRAALSVMKYANETANEVDVL